MPNFDGTQSKSDKHARQAIGQLLIEFKDIFAKQGFEIGINKDFKVEMTPIAESLAYGQNLPTPINLKEHMTVDLALLHEHSIFTTVPINDYSILFLRKENRTVNYNCC